MQSVSCHKISIDGVLRNVFFNLSGSTVTYIMDAYICKQLNGWADMVIDWSKVHGRTICGFVFQGEEDVCWHVQLEERNIWYGPIIIYPLKPEFAFVLTEWSVQRRESRRKPPPRRGKSRLRGAGSPTTDQEGKSQGRKKR
jgi:hypothetical protein